MNEIIKNEPKNVYRIMQKIEEYAVAMAFCVSVILCV